MYKICVVTATRAEYGVLKNTIKRIIEDEELNLYLVATGMHLSRQYGYTIQEIIDDGIPVSDTIEILSEENDERAIVNAMGKEMIAFGEIFQREKPDMLLVVGDRYEILPACQCAVIFGVPIAHISGGEITEGAIHDSIRHAVTKLSHLHFPGCEVYRQRIIQMGEEPERVFNYGDVGIENIKKMVFMTKGELEKSLNISLDKPYACVTFHPVTLEKDSAEHQIKELLYALQEIKDMYFIFTKANADLEGKIINDCIDDFVKENENSAAFYSVGIKRYLSLLKEAEFVIGNSSSGIIEAPSLNIPTVNIGDRQKGRLQAESILNCRPVKEEIIRTIGQARSKEFKEKMKKISNPYEMGETSILIVNEMKRFLNAENSKIKHFYDIIQKAD